jgi:AbrB family looped-hinge helix DNA binding protein
MTTLTVTAKGQITLRKAILRHLGVTPGEKLEVDVLPDGQVTIRAAKPSAGIDGFIGRLAGRSGETVSLEDMDQAAASGWAGGT